MIIWMQRVVKSTLGESKKVKGIMDSFGWMMPEQLWMEVSVDERHEEEEEC